MLSADQALERLNDMVSYQMYQMNQTIYDNLENSPDLLEHISDEEITAIILQNCVLLLALHLQFQVVDNLKEQTSIEFRECTFRAAIAHYMNFLFDECEFEGLLQECSIATDKSKLEEYYALSDS